MPIHTFHIGDTYEIWSDPKGEHRMGRKLAEGADLAEAKWDAVESLTADLLQLTKPMTVIEER